jgi:hypothetical protein
MIIKNGTALIINRSLKGTCLGFCHEVINGVLKHINNIFITIAWVRVDVLKAIHKGMITPVSKMKMENKIINSGTAVHAPIFFNLNIF